MRFRHIGGHVVNETRQVVPLGDVEGVIREHHRRARVLRLMGERRLAREWALAALTLHYAAEECAKWRRASGWMDPLDADRMAAR